MPIITTKGGLPPGITSPGTGRLTLNPGANASSALVLTNNNFDYFTVGTDGALAISGGVGGGGIVLEPSQLLAVLSATPDSAITVHSDHTEIDLPAGGNLRVYDINFNLIFTVDEADGSVHIKTGTAIIADL